jgi:hypothetical protein
MRQLRRRRVEDEGPILGVAQPEEDVVGESLVLHGDHRAERRRIVDAALHRRRHPLDPLRRHDAAGANDAVAAKSVDLFSGKVAQG